MFKVISSPRIEVNEIISFIKDSSQGNLIRLAMTAPTKNLTEGVAKSSWFRPNKEPPAKGFWDALSQTVLILFARLSTHNRSHHVHVLGTAHSQMGREGTGQGCPWDNPNSTGCCRQTGGIWPIKPVLERRSQCTSSHFGCERTAAGRTPRKGG